MSAQIATFDAAGASVAGTSDTSNTAEPVTQPARPSPTPVPVNINTQPAPPTFFTIKVSVRADNTNNGWTNSGLVVRRGQRLRITSSGRVDWGRRGFSTPGGLP